MKLNCLAQQFNFYSSLHKNKLNPTQTNSNKIHFKILKIKSGVIVLFDSGASYSFISDQFVAKHNRPTCPMKQNLLVSSPGKELKANQLCSWVNMNIMGIEFLTILIVLESSGIDVILGMDWLAGCD